MGILYLSTTVTLLKHLGTLQEFLHFTYLQFFSFKMVLRYKTKMSKCLLFPYFKGICFLISKNQSHCTLLNQWGINVVGSLPDISVCQKLKYVSLYIRLLVCHIRLFNFLNSLNTFLGDRSCRRKVELIRTFIFRLLFELI